MACDSNGITQFYLRPTHELYPCLYIPAAEYHCPVAATAPTRRDGRDELTWVAGYIQRYIFPQQELNPVHNHPSKY